MKVMLDTNVLISAFIFGGTAGRILRTLFASPLEYDLYVSEYVDAEFHDKLRMKWPDRAEHIYQAYRKTSIIFCQSTKTMLCDLRDPKDIPVLSDALYHNVDILLTGDKDFLEANIEHPLIYSPSMMNEYLKKSST